MLNKLFLATVFFYSTLTLAQQSLMKEDFAFGNEIVITDQKSVVQITLPEDVYKTAINPSLSDLGIFNSHNEVVPHVFVAPAVKTIEKELPSEALTLFPIYGEKGEQNGFENIKVSTSNNGAIVNIQNNKQTNNNKIITGYLIDTSKIKHPINKLQFSVDDLQENQLIKISVEGSNDLKTWNTIGSEDVLGKFEINNEKLIRNELALHGSKYKYYRLAWSSHDGVKLNAAKAIFIKSEEKQKENLQWMNVASKKIENPQHKTLYEYDLGGYYPICAVRVKFADQNSTADLSIEAAANEKGPWTAIESVNFFTLMKDNTNLAKLQADFDPQKFRFWRVMLNSNMAGVGSHFPEISFGWQPISLRFLARGVGPFTLAYGSSTTENLPQTDLINSEMTKEVGTGTLKEKIALGGPEKLVVVEKSEYPWKKIMLWSLLLMGVALLGFMAFQVKKQT